MSARLRAIARQTEEIVAAGRYQAPDGRTVSVAEDLAAALAGTRLYGPEPVTVTPDTDRTPTLDVTGESSLAAARRMTAADATRPVAVLNFASARNPGGGYLNGAQAQEEALCRSSALHATLLRAPGYYAHHREERDVLYTDRVIHSPCVPVFRDDRGALLAAPFTVGFLTSPAPNAGVVRRRTPALVDRLPGALASRAERVLETAAAAGHRRLVLGAWGCGVFQNDPEQVVAPSPHCSPGRVASLYHFEEIVFAVLDRAQGAPTLAAFARVVGAAAA